MNFLKRFENREKYNLILDYATADFTGIETNQITSFHKPVSYFYSLIHERRNMKWFWNSFSLAEIRYTKDHYWVERIKSTDEYKVGLSDYAQDSYGDFVVVEIERMNEVVDKDGKYILMVVGQRGNEPLEIF